MFKIDEKYCIVKRYSLIYVLKKFLIFWIKYSGDGEKEKDGNSRLIRGIGEKVFILFFFVSCWFEKLDE